MSSGCSSAPIQASRASMTWLEMTCEGLVAVAGYDLHQALFAKLAEVILGSVTPSE